MSVQFQENKGLQLLKTTIAKAVTGMNVAASEFYRSDKTYDLKLSRQWMQATQDVNELQAIMAFRRALMLIAEQV
ncbi:Hypothetical predicted protein [Olea europaea subsp. europaea]|uniref:Uncharacterized protein n=1 Tax=Olea europaea subsp. europaea TaxID=158383 RepID=A0A8S0TV76_OLEEU|nr:Hypothetical predicted protein [Olea europaea subsp. europaea]